MSLSQFIIASTGTRTTFNCSYPQARPFQKSSTDGTQNLAHPELKPESSPRSRILRLLYISVNIRKLILVIGATGAQGMAVIRALLAPSEDGPKSPYRVRALTRDATSQRALELTAQGVECFEGAFDDFTAVAAAFEGVYGAWVNTDGFTVAEQAEIYCGLKIYEIAKRTPSVRHYVWSNLDYSSQKGGWNPIYECGHYDGKGRVAEFLKSQPSVVGDDTFSWSVLTTGPYMDMLNIQMFGPLNRRADGTFVFASPIGDGHVPMIALSDLGFWARYTFDHRAETSGKDLEVASEMVGWDYLVSTFTKVTGHPAVFIRQTLDEWWSNFDGVDLPVADYDRQPGKGSGTPTSVRRNFSGFWSQWRDDVITRDMVWIRSVNPKGHTVESWMRENGYQGSIGRKVLKNVEDGKGGWTVNRERVAKL